MAVLWWNPWNFDAEPGDIMVTDNGRAFRLWARKNSPRCKAGELFTRELKKPGMYATIEEGELVWKKREETQ